MPRKKKVSGEEVGSMPPASSPLNSKFGILEAAMFKLSTESPFYGPLLYSMNRRIGEGELPPNALMATGMKNGKITLYSDPKLIESFSVQEVKTILEHECMHVIFSHFDHDLPIDDSNWKIAQELAINGLLDISQRLKDISIVPGHGTFKDLPPKETTGFYYEKLPKESENNPIVQFFKHVMSGGCKQCNSGNDGNSKDGNENNKDGASGKPCDGQLKISCGGFKSSGDKLSNDLSIKILVNEGISRCKSKGSIPGALQSILQDLLAPPKIRWQTILRSCVGSRIRSSKKNTWIRPNRRFGDSTMGKIWIKRPAILIAIDTSGSVDDALLTNFFAEIESIRQIYNARFTLLQCDAEIQGSVKVSKSQKMNLEVKGRGGTSFVPVFEQAEKESPRPELIIYFTDLYGDFPTDNKIPTIWVVPPGSENVNPPFGTVVTME